MKSSLILTTLILTITSASLARAAQHIAVRQPEFNFGTITQGQSVEHVFIVKNDGDQPLTIKSIRPSCGCTAAEASSKVIQPGKISKIKVTFNSANFSGAIHKTIAIETDDPKTHVSTLFLKGFINEELTVNPHQINLGILKQGSSKEVAVTIANNAKRPLKLVSVKSPTPQINVKTDKDILKPGESVTIKVSVLPHSGDRMLSGYISIITDNPTKKEVIIPVFASVVK